MLKSNRNALRSLTPRRSAIIAQGRRIYVNGPSFFPPASFLSGSARPPPTTYVGKEGAVVEAHEDIQVQVEHCVCFLVYSYYCILMSTSQSLQECGRGSTHFYIYIYLFIYLFIYIYIYIYIYLFIILLSIAPLLRQKSRRKSKAFKDIYTYIYIYFLASLAYSPFILFGDCAYRRDTLIFCYKVDRNLPAPCNVEALSDVYNLLMKRNLLVRLHMESPIPSFLFLFCSADSTSIEEGTRNVQETTMHYSPSKGPKLLLQLRFWRVLPLHALFLLFFILVCLKPHLEKYNNNFDNTVSSTSENFSTPPEEPPGGGKIEEGTRNVQETTMHYSPSKGPKLLLQLRFWRVLPLHALFLLFFILVCLKPHLEKYNNNFDNRKAEKKTKQNSIFHFRELLYSS
eukprot:gene11737-8075_t